jgi:hypothetical protein
MVAFNVKCFVCLLGLTISFSSLSFLCTIHLQMLESAVQSAMQQGWNSDGSAGSLGGHQALRRIGALGSICAGRRFLVPRWVRRLEPCRLPNLVDPPFAQ